MDRVIGPGASHKSSKTPFNSVRTNADKFIATFFPYAISNVKDKTFIIDAIAYYDNLIFIYLECPTIQSLQKRIKSDIANLSKVKYQSANLYYFIDAPPSMLNNKQAEFGYKNSTPDFKVIILDEQKIIEQFIFSNNLFTNFNSNMLPQFYNFLNRSYQIQENVLEEIFAYVNVEDIDESKVVPIDTKLIHLRKKIGVNFLDNNYLDVLKTYYQLWIEKEYVEHFIKTNYHRYKRQLQGMLEKIRTNYKVLSHNKKQDVEFPVNGPIVFERLAELFVPIDKASDIRYSITAKAIILFFFEYCDFGKKSPDDPPSLFQQSSGLDDDTSH